MRKVKNRKVERCPNLGCLGLWRLDVWKFGEIHILEVRKLGGIQSANVLKTEQFGSLDSLILKLDSAIQTSKLCRASKLWDSSIFQTSRRWIPPHFQTFKFWYVPNFQTPKLWHNLLFKAIADGTAKLAVSICCCSSVPPWTHETKKHSKFVLQAHPCRRLGADRGHFCSCSRLCAASLHGTVWEVWYQEHFKMLLPYRMVRLPIQMIS